MNTQNGQGRGEPQGVVCPTATATPELANCQCLNRTDRVGHRLPQRVCMHHYISIQENKVRWKRISIQGAEGGGLQIRFEAGRNDKINSAVSKQILPGWNDQQK